MASLGVATMKQFWPLVVVFVPFNSASSQEVEHAPTVEQCRADHGLMVSKFEKGIDKLDPISPVSYKELMKWQVEMIDCRQVDAENYSTYRNTAFEIESEMNVRVGRFLERHHLWNQFLAEDAQGKR